MILAVANQKGGVGKTTTAVSLAHGLVLKGKRVLLIDLDAQGHLSAITGTAVHNADESLFSFYAAQRLLAGLIREGLGGWPVIPAHVELSKVDSQFGKGPQVLNKLNQGIVKERLNTGRPIIMDCCPMLGVLSLNAIFAADVSEAVPLPATALLPAALFPLLQITGVHGGCPVDFSLQAVLVNYAHPVIYLFFGGFLLAGAMQKWKLDRRITLWLLTRGRIADDTRWVLLAIMSVTAFLSMWISNTATAAMMLPMGLGILSLMALSPGESRFGTEMMLGIGWSASIGGMGTIIGTPPNGIALGILDSTLGGDPGYVRITFLDWMKFGVPLVVVFLPVAWLVLLALNPPEVRHIPGGRARMQLERSKLGPLSAGEKRAKAIPDRLSFIVMSSQR